MIVTNDRITPFLRWPGGKRWLVDRVINQIDYGKGKKYIEPFVGSGAIFFAHRPEHAIISDVNSELIELYVVMRDHPEELRQCMINHQDHHSREYYYKTRAEHPRSSIARAARMLYLNRTCFNGMYRVNKHGDFNVPIGSKSNCIYDVDMFVDYSNILKKADIRCADFADVLFEAEDGDFIFADPPYAVCGKNIFTKYNDNLFTWNDQMRLFSLLKKSRDCGVNILSTNAYSEELVTMYESAGFCVSRVNRPCSMAGDPRKRMIVDEMIVSTKPLGEKKND